MPITLYVEEAHHGERLDVYLARQQEEHPRLRGLSRTRLQQLIREGHVTVAGEAIRKPNHRLGGGEAITVKVPEPQPAEARPEDLPLGILYQDEHLAVIVKPAGMVVHPSGSRVSGTLVNALLHHLTDLSGIGGQLRPGIVHRLDKGTSGLMLVAKNNEAHQRLAEAFKQRSIQKTYLALVQGRFKKKEGVIDFPLARHRTQRHKIAAVMQRNQTGPAESPFSEEPPGGGRHRKVKAAVTRYEVLRSWEEASQVTLWPQTGRTHQIRVHLSQIGHPVLGDSTYGYSHTQSRRIPGRLIEGLNGPALHAWKLELCHPITGQPLQFEAEIPTRIQNLIDYLGDLEQYSPGVTPT